MRPLRSVKTAGRRDSPARRPRAGISVIPGSGMAPTGSGRRRRSARHLGTDTRWRTTQRAGKWCSLADSWQAVQATRTRPSCSGHVVWRVDNGAFSRNDTWSWNGTEWAQLNPATSPPARTNHAMAYDSTRTRRRHHSRIKEPASATSTPESKDPKASRPRDRFQRGAGRSAGCNQPGGERGQR